MKILYLSVHSVLEYEECQLFHELGHYVFSGGSYVCPENPGDPDMRPGIPGMVVDPDDRARYDRLDHSAGHDAKESLSREFVEPFDVVIVMHDPRYIVGNWSVIKDKHVVWRTIGQSIQPQEQMLSQYRAAGLKIVRYSPMERRIPGYIGMDALIRFYKDPDEYTGWTGEEPYVITVNQGMKIRTQACNYDLYSRVMDGLPAKLFGPQNKGIPQAAGRLSFEELKEAYRKYRCYFYVGTHPASYTLNYLEAWMSAIPIVAIGPAYGNSLVHKGHFLYEVHKLIEHGVSGFCTDDPDEMRSCIQQLLDDHDLAAKIGAAGREMAIELFGKAAIKQQWADFLNSL